LERVPGSERSGGRYLGIKGQLGKIRRQRFLLPENNRDQQFLHDDEGFENHREKIKSGNKR
jgi:hypothetical protein